MMTLLIQQQYQQVDHINNLKTMSYGYARNERNIQKTIKELLKKKFN